MYNRIKVADKKGDFYKHIITTRRIYHANQSTRTFKTCGQECQLWAHRHIIQNYLSQVFALKNA
jgi:hypothetical protein